MRQDRPHDVDQDDHHQHCVDRADQRSGVIGQRRHEGDETLDEYDNRQHEQHDRDAVLNDVDQCPERCPAADFGPRQDASGP